MSHTKIKVTIYHGGKKRTHEVRNDGANVRDGETAKNKGDKGLTRVGKEKVMTVCWLTKYLRMSLCTQFL